MKPTVKLSDIVENIEMANEGADSFYNEITGEFYYYSYGFTDDYRDLDEEEGWVRLPSQRDANEYEMMSDFSDSIRSTRKREQLEIALSGRGAFRRFKDAVIREGIAEMWYAYRDRRYLDFAREWCEENEIPYDRSELPDEKSNAEPKIGLYVDKTATATVIVNQNNTAKAVGSGDLDVFATPMMITLMERAACNCVADEIEANQTTVGTHIDVEHTAASPLGAKITAEATITAIDGRKIEFEVVASDSYKEIGRGIHERVVVDTERFMAKVNVKK